MTDERALLELSRAEGWLLLASVPVGRLVFTHQALPAIRPVNHVVDGDKIVIGLMPGRRRSAPRGGPRAHRQCPQATRRSMTYVSTRSARSATNRRCVTARRIMARADNTSGGSGGRQSHGAVTGGADAGPRPAFGTPPGSGSPVIPVAMRLRKPRIVAVATRCRITRSSASPSAPSGGR